MASVGTVIRTMSPQEEAIADSAITVIVNEGLDAASVRRVAKEAGVAPGTVQYFMGTKELLLQKALLRSTRRQHERVSATSLPPGTDPLERLGASLAELLPIGEIQREDAALWVILGGAASTRPGLAGQYQRELEMFRDRLIHALGGGPAGEHNDTVARTARLITALVNGLTLDYLNTPPGEGTRSAIMGDLAAGLGRLLAE
ncbi:TetR/AcrR family transcriptional regulator [Corynebacterium sp. UBA2622]|uniref:TetR/AcrR family transcriptional regulator n=1 Tax=Corynebacterium sp. UBA2622 TaxID=1946393 RepID=UPI0025C18332|nr:TetR/AcrR family transcriptional regulator [Corynebacterium sp. UBA2622]